MMYLPFQSTLTFQQPFATHRLQQARKMRVCLYLWCGACARRLQARSSQAPDCQPAPRWLPPRRSLHRGALGVRAQAPALPRTKESNWKGGEFPYRLNK
eukprot:4395924-Pleurochrysis_carterae.AAC.2